LTTPIVPVVRPICTDIHDVNEEPMPENDLYMAIWQSSPAIPRYAAYNWDGLSWSDPSYAEALFGNHLVQLGDTYHLPDPDNEEEVAENEIDVDWFSDYMPLGQNASEPVFDIMYPILETIDRVTINDPLNHTLVGTAALSVYWRNLLEDILPAGSEGVVVVFDSPCNPSFTYQINGPSVDYLGRGDLHDTSYDRNLVESSIVDINAFASSASSYSGIKVDADYCPHTIRMYPSSLTESNYTTSTPLILCFATVGIFLFTAFIFIAYDLMVERRQKKVLTSATKTSAIVSSLFPSNVRDRMFEQTQGQQQQQKQGLDAFSGLGNAESNANDLSSPPIADLFPETTVFFADMSGFTKWSSTRSPADVFRLLETLYGAFDEIARQRNVFKVETIGDCYVAVTGLPKPQPNHAVIMVRFARDCMIKMNVVINDLAEQLGEDTRLLEMRVGLHSGATTAGVLRGEKGRFQLFGDTVNTASRMESNGVKGKIHVSEATADRLIKKGKESWLVEREDRIVAKGKGEMKTYFVVGTHAKSSYSGCETLSCDTGVSSSGDDEAGIADDDVQAMVEMIASRTQSDDGAAVAESDIDDHALLAAMEAQIRSRFPEVPAQDDV
jgi:class 3 adenylate cyclase